MKFEQNKTAASNIICVTVATEKDFGYWEINPETKKAYFRDHATLPAEDKVISDYSPACKTIVDYLRDHHDVKHTKTIIPDRKVIFGDTPFCSWSKTRKTDDGRVTMVYCQHPALVSVASQDEDEDEYRPKLYCGEHAPIGGGNSEANIKTPKMVPAKNFTSTASVKGA